MDESRVKARTEKLIAQYIFDGELEGDPDWTICGLYTCAFRDGLLSMEEYNNACRYYYKQSKLHTPYNKKEA